MTNHKGLDATASRHFMSSHIGSRSLIYNIDVEQWLFHDVTGQKDAICFSLVIYFFSKNFFRSKLLSLHKRTVRVQGMLF